MGCHGRGGRGERRAVVTPTRGARTPSAPPQPATDAGGAARSRAVVGRAVRVAQAVLCRPADAPEGGPRGLKIRGRSPAVPGACHVGRWPSRPVGGWSKGGRAQEGDGAGKGAVMRCGGVYSAACREEVLKGDYKEASTGDMVRHDGGRALSRRPAGRPEGPAAHALRRRCRGQKRRSEGVSAAI